MTRLLLLGLFMLVSCQGSPTVTDDPWRPLRFLSGCWLSDDDDGTSLETWTPPHGNSMYGQNRAMHRGQLVFFELLTIERRGDQFVYIAQPRGGKPTEFVMTGHQVGSAGASVTFENPKHDFPKRIRYRRTMDGELSARVDDGTGTGKHVEFHWQPVR